MRALRGGGYRICGLHVYRVRSFIQLAPENMSRKCTKLNGTKG